MTEVPKQALNVLLDYLFILYHGDKLALTQFDCTLRTLKCMHEWLTVGLS